MTWLLFYILAVSLYDLRTRRIPNWCTLPLISAGMIANFPGHKDLWLICFLLVSAWASGWMEPTRRPCMPQQKESLQQETESTERMIERLMYELSPEGNDMD